MEEAPAARCVALLVALGDECGEVLLTESVRSYTEPKQVTGVLVADVASPSRLITLPTLRDSVVLATVVPCPGATRDDALNVLRATAMDAGYTHALIGHTHERLVRQLDSQMVEELPTAWETTDLLQTVSDVKFRPLVDVLVRLSRFRFAGPVMPAPVPIGTALASLNIAAWQGVCVCAITYKVSMKRAYDIVLQTQVKLAGAHPMLPEYGMLQFQLIQATLQAQLYAECNTLLRERIKQGSSGWGGNHGLYAAHLLKCKVADKLERSFTDQLPDLFDAAELGLKLGRMEGLVMMNIIAARCKSNKHRVVTLALAACCAFPAAYQVPSWMGSPSSYAISLREALGIGLYMQNAGSKVAYEQLAASASRPGARKVPSAQTNYKMVAKPGDTAPMRAYFPDPCDLLLPQLEVYANFIRAEHLAEAVAEFTHPDGINCAEFSWLETLLQNVLRLPYAMTWGKTLEIGHASAPTRVIDTTGGPFLNTQLLVPGTWFQASEGFIFLLPLRLVEQVVLTTDDGCGLSQTVMVPGTLYVLRAGLKWVLLAPAEVPSPDNLMVFVQLHSPLFK